MEQTTPVPEKSELSASLEVMLHGYLCHAFQVGMHYQEAMRHYENIRALLNTLAQTHHGNTHDKTAA